MFAQKVKLLPRIVTKANEELSLAGVYDLEISNLGRDIVLDFNGAYFPLASGAVFKPPLGQGKMYSDSSKIAIRDTARKMITRTYYKHPDYNDGEFTSDPTTIYVQDYQDNKLIVKTYPSLINTKNIELESFMKFNEADDYKVWYPNLLGISGNNSVWTTPELFGLAQGWNLYKRWDRFLYDNKDTDIRTGFPYHEPPVRAGFDYITWVTNWFSLLNYQKFLFFYKECDLGGVGSFKAQSTAFKEDFYTIIGFDLTGLGYSYVSEHQSMTDEINTLNSELLTSENYISEFDAKVTIEERKFLLSKDPDTGETVETPYNPKTDTPIHVSILFTIEDN